MKKIITIILLGLTFNISAQETKKVLFLGNSYTYGNDLPNLLYYIAQANGDVLIKDQNTPGGYTFNGHSTNATSLNKIASDDWDYVVLQAQSQEPSFSPGQVASQTKPYAKILCDSVYSNNICSEPMFFMTWGRENGDASNCASYPPICTYEGMQQRLRESYLEMAVENNATCAPVGMAWKKVRSDFPAINLYAADGSHPNINGSYLAACVFYSSIYHKSSVGNTYTSSLDSLTAFRLQTIATNTVFDSLNVWHIDTSAAFPIIKDSLITGCGSVDFNGITYTSDITFSDTISGNSCEAELINYVIDIIGEEAEITDFQQKHPAKTNETGIFISINAINFDTIFLYQNDTIVSYYTNIPNNIITYYCTNNSFEELDFILVAINSCNKDSLAAEFTCGSLSSINNLKFLNWQISPNPTNNFIEINSLNNEKIVSSILDLTGREVVSKTDAQRIDMSAMEKGIYFLVIYNEKGEALGQEKIVKN